MDQQTSEKTKRSNRSPPYALFNLLVIVVAIAYGAYHQMYLAKQPGEATTASEQSVDVPSVDDELEKIPLFTVDELNKFDGVSKYHFILISDFTRLDIKSKRKQKKFLRRF